jgi:hypothetical protein
MDDRTIVSVQIGRELRGPLTVACRCHLGLPAVIEVEPVLDDGTPFPTRYWLTCPVAQRQVSGLESQGLVREFQARRNTDPEFAAQCDDADAAYAADRDRFVPEGHVGPRPTGGVGGTRGGVKCLHAHLAHHLARGPNPIGAEVATMVGRPACTAPCV